MWICFGVALFIADNDGISPFVDTQTVEKWPFRPHAAQKAFFAIYLFFDNCSYHNPHSKGFYWSLVLVLSLQLEFSSIAAFGNTVPLFSDFLGLSLERNVTFDIANGKRGSWGITTYEFSCFLSGFEFSCLAD